MGFTDFHTAMEDLVGRAGAYLGEGYLVNQGDRYHNASLVAGAETRFKKGQVVLHHGFQVRITAVLPKGFISWSESKSPLTGKKLGPVTCDRTLYRYEAVDPLAGGSPSGQTTEDELSELRGGTTAKSSF